MNVTTHIDHLPDPVLVEILCRLPCYKSVSQCKSVSKRWRTLMSDDPHFIGRFLCVELADHEQPPVLRTLINTQGDEFLGRMSASSKPLTLLFKRFMCLKEEPVVAGTYNDLVLCYTGKYDRRDYYICNPFTKQFVALPPAPQCHNEIEPPPEGFMCDLPYYNYKKDDEKGEVVQVNTEYRCRVVRLCIHDQIMFRKFKVQIFSSETGEWREAIVSSPAFLLNRINCPICYANASNGMLYWISYDLFILGLDPFMINTNNSPSLSTTSSSSTESTDDEEIIDQHECRVTSFPEEIIYEDGEDTIIRPLGVYGGCLRMLDQDNHRSDTLYLWDLNEDHLRGGGGKVWLEHMKCYSLNRFMMPFDGYGFHFFACDPNDEDIWFLHLSGKVFMFNIRTKKWLQLAENSWDYCYFFFPIVIPRWPTPVPRLPQHGQPTPGPSSALKYPTFKAGSSRVAALEDDVNLCAAKVQRTG